MQFILKRTIKEILGSRKTTGAMQMIATAITYYLIYCVVMMALTAAVITSWCKGYEEGVKDGQM